MEDLMATAADKKRWDKLKADYAKAREAYDAHDIQLMVKYGSSFQRSWLSRTEAKKLEQLRDRMSTIGEKITDLLVSISPRGDRWLGGVPAVWIYEKLTWEDATRPENEPLSVVVPGAYGYRDGHMKEQERRRTWVPPGGENQVDCADAKAMVSYLPYLDTPYIDPKPRGYGYGSIELCFATMEEARRFFRQVVESGDVEKVKLYEECAKCPFRRRLIDEFDADAPEGVTEVRERGQTMKITIPTMTRWEQIGGDVNPGAYGGTIALADGDHIELLKIQPVREYVGDNEAADVGFPFWTREAWFDLDDLNPERTEVKRAMVSVGLTETDLEDLTPGQRALAIAEALLDYGHAEEGPAGWSTDIIHDKVKWASGEIAGAEYLADEDDDFRREVLGEEDEEEYEDE
jgi:hypothetical protein